MKTKILKSIWLPIMVLTLLTVFSSCQKEPAASFTVSSTSIEVGESVIFTNTSTDGDSYEWKFGDGSTSTTVSPIHTYNTAGIYTVTLTAFSKNEKKSDKATEAITVSWQCGEPFTDSRDGQTYNTVQIGSQCWMAENLNYDAGSGSWCYNNNASNCTTYGRLYNWATALTVAPAGWHLPTDDEWKTLEMYLGMSQAEADATDYRGTDEGGKLKDTGTTHWDSPNTGATNSSGFTALPGGYRSGYDGLFKELGYDGHWWSATENGANAWYRILYYSNSQVRRVNTIKAYGFSVRCVKD